jgi:hypothetical protein
MNLVDIYSAYGKRGLRAWLRSQWAPSTYMSDRRIRQRAISRNTLKSWGLAVSKALGSKDYPTLGVLLGNPPEGATVPDKAYNVLRAARYHQCTHDNRWYHVSQMTHMRRQDVYIANCNMEASGCYVCATCNDAFTGGRGRIETRDNHILYCSNGCADRGGVFRTEEGHVYSEECNAPPVFIYRYNQTFVGPIGTQDSYPLGIELEIEFEDEDVKHDFARLVRDKYSRDTCHCKRDGSLSECGVELVTGYGPYKDLAPIVEEVALLADELGGRSYGTDTCGQHISLGRSELSLSQQARFVVFFNHPANQEFLHTFARRNSARFAVTIPTKATDEFIEMCNDDYDRLMGDKYEAVNCNHRSHLEVRIFKGSLNVNTILSRLSLVRLVGEFCEEKRSAKQLLHTDFTKWLKKRGDDCEMFKNIEHYLKRRKQSHLLLEEATC